MCSGGWICSAEPLSSAHRQRVCACPCSPAHAWPTAHQPLQVILISQKLTRPHVCWHQQNGVRADACVRSVEVSAVCPNVSSALCYTGHNTTALHPPYTFLHLRPPTNHGPTSRSSTAASVLSKQSAVECCSSAIRAVSVQRQGL